MNFLLNPGSFSFDTQQVYESNGHEVYRKWLALCDSKGKREGVQGYLKASVTALAPGEQPPAHEQEEEEDDEGGDSLQSMVLMPPTLATGLGCIEANIYKAENFPKTDTCKFLFTEQ